MPQAQTGKTRSVPKVVRVNAADRDAIIYRNLGDGHRLPFMWGTSVTLASGTTSVVVASGVSFNDDDVADAMVFVSPSSSGAQALNYYVKKDVLTKAVTIETSSAPAADVIFDVLVMLGVGYSSTNIESTQLWKRGANNY